MNNEFDIDLEELESRLYSQVYHGNAEDNEDQTTFLNIPEKLHYTRQNTRYFQVNSSSKKHHNNEFNYISPNRNSVGKGKLHAADFFDINTDIVNTSVPADNNQIPPVVHMVTPCNNILPQTPPAPIISNGEYIQTNEDKTNLGKYVDRQSRKYEKKQRKLERYKQKRKEKKKLLREQRAVKTEIKKDAFKIHHLNINNLPQTNNSDDIVAISDTDDDSCVEILQFNELVVVSSDESDDDKEKENVVYDQSDIEHLQIKTDLNPCPNNAKVLALNDEDDVLCIDVAPEDLEVIEVDCDSKSIVNVGNSKISSEKSIELSCTSSNANKSIHATRQGTLHAKERNELLQTPDSTSTSNDFLDSMLDLQQKKFNFALHDVDFGGNHNFIRPKSHTDLFETESSCSASDNSTTIKNTVFNEIEFETPSKELFNETNLETFGNYITPNRDSRVESTASSEKSEYVTTKASSELQKCSFDNSDSSSESDYDCDTEAPINRVKRKLPDLTSVTSVNVDKSLMEADSSLNANSTSKRKSEVLGDTPTPKRKPKSENGDTQQSNDVQNNDNVMEKNPLYMQATKSVSRENFKATPPDKSISTSNTNSSEVFYVSDDEAVSEIEFLNSDISLANCGGVMSTPQKNSEADTVTGFTKYWTSDMNKFYNTSWGLEDFSVEETQSTMSDDRKLWKILDEDRARFGMRTPKSPRCHRCREIGHLASRCRNGVRPIVCTLCGRNGHLEPRCPNAVCTLCGSHGGYGTYCSQCAAWAYKQCKICYMYGHTDQACPDLWRRYHLTIQPGPTVKPLKPNYKFTQDRWCSGCARSGHLEHQCRYYTRSHHSVDPHIKDYHDVYNFPKSQPFIIQSDFTKPPAPCKNLKVVKRKDEINSNTPSTKDDRIKTDNVEIADTTDLGRDTSQEKSEISNIKVTFANFIFPPLEMIPHYFREDMNMTEDRMGTNKNGCQLDNVDRELKDPTGTNTRDVDVPVLKIVPPSTAAPTNSNDKSNTSVLSVNHKVLAYLHSSKGKDFIYKLQHQANTSITLSREGEDDNLGGKITVLCQDFRDTLKIKREFQKFFRTIPKLGFIPRFSKAAFNFLTPKLEKVEKVVGNCKLLYDNLNKLKSQQKNGQDTLQMNKKIRDATQHLNMLLFGKLKLGSGQTHMDVLRTWQRYFERHEDYKIPLSVLYDLFDSYSYIFLDTVKHNYKAYCNPQPLMKHCSFENQPTQKHWKLISQYSRLVEKKCHQFNLKEKLREFQCFKSSVNKSNLSTKIFKEFMTFCHNFLRDVKMQS